MRATLKFLIFWVLRLSQLCGWGLCSSGIWCTIITQGSLDMMQCHNPRENPSQIWRSIISQDTTFNLIPILVNIPSTVTSTKIWLLQSTKICFHCFRASSITFSFPLHICNQTSSNPLTKQAHFLYYRIEAEESCGNNKANYMVKTQKMIIVWIRQTTDSLWTSTCTTSQCNPAHTATVNPPLITKYLCPLHSGHLADYRNCYMNSFFN
jgi:hypothetical protein